MDITRIKNNIAIYNFLNKNIAKLILCTLEIQPLEWTFYLAYADIPILACADILILAYINIFISAYADITILIKYIY